MNIEDYREYCLSLGEDIEEKLPFQKFKNGEGVLVFYVMGHMFSFFDCNDFSVISLKCQPERIEDLKAQYECIGNPYNESPKHWIGINPTTAPDDLLKELTRNSYKIVKAKYTNKKDMKLLFSFLLTVASLSAFAQQTIKISGRVTDFNDKPISNCTVMLMDGRFNAIDSVVTDSVGFYLMNGIKPGKYMALTAIKWDEYVRFSKLPEQDRRLEFWAWNIIADKDLIINPRYHRLELYGTTAFCPTGTNALMVYTRPMSATEAMKYDEKLYRDNNNGVIDYSVKLEDFQVQAFIDDREVKIRHIANTTEQYGNQKMGAFILMLDYNVRHDDRTVHKIRITAENVKYHEKGENICFFQNSDCR